MQPDPLLPFYESKTLLHSVVLSLGMQEPRIVSEKTKNDNRAENKRYHNYANLTESSKSNELSNSKGHSRPHLQVPSFNK